MDTIGAIIHSFLITKMDLSQCQFFVVKTVVEMAVAVKTSMSSNITTTTCHGSLGRGYFLCIDLAPTCITIT